MAKTNYGQLKRQKEAARKAKHQKKLERRQTRVGEEAPPDGEDGENAATTGEEPGSTPPPNENGPAS